MSSLHQQLSEVIRRERGGKKLQNSCGTLPNELALGCARGSIAVVGVDTEAKVVYEFGPFRMDPGNRILLRHNEPISLPPKVFETLLVLVRRSREVVSKDELLNTIWPDSFVEEANLTQNIFTLRKALGDTPEERRYILTVPGRGYRFAAAVRTLPQGGETLIAQTRSRTQIVIEEQEKEENRTAGALPASTHATAKWRLVSAIVASVAVAAVATILLLRGRRTVPVNEKNSVLVADFSNSTGDSIFDNVLRQGLEVQLEQSPSLSIVSDHRIRQTLRLMGQKPDARVTGELARDICVRTGTTAMLEGSIQSVGSQYLLTVRATDCPNGELLGEEQEQIAKKEDLLGSLSRISSRLRERVGESRATVATHDVPLAEATTPSLDALRAYSLGVQAEDNRDEKAAIPFFQRAVEIDPGFAAAYAWLALEYGANGSSALATENIRKAYELRDRASDRERFFISAYYFGRATGNQEKAREVCQQWAQTYPRDYIPHQFLSGFVYPVLANYDGAIQEGRTALDLAPESASSYMLLSRDLLYLGGLNETEEILRKAREHNFLTPELLIVQFDLAFSRGDAEGMQRAVSVAQGKPDLMDWLLDRQAFAFAYAGQMQKATALSRHAVDLAQQQGDHERAALFRTREALWEAFFGNLNQAKQTAESALSLGRNREVDYGTAVVLALAGDAQRAEALANALEKDFPDDTSVRFNYLPVIRGILAIKGNEPLKALGVLDSATPYELGSPRSAVVWYFGTLYPIMIRGDAFLAVDKGEDAAREYEKILAHRDLMIGDPLVALVEYRLARAHEVAGEPLKARSQYEKFLALWRDADPDIPIYQQAKAEHARLQ